jgi:membrane fusion protein, multidrug efflux system
MVEMPRPQQFHELQELAVVAAPAPPAPSRGSKIKRAALALALLAGTAAGGCYGYHYWTVGQYLQSTDDAYVKADYTTVAPKVSGYITEVLVEDNVPVKAGQVVARIDDRDFRTAVAEARANVAASEAAIRNLDAQIKLQGSLVEQAEASIAASQAALTFAVADAARYRDLIKTGSGTLQRAQQTQSTRDQGAAQLRRDQAALVAATDKIAVLVTARSQAEAQRDRSGAAAQQAELNLSYTSITAPVDGTVGARALRVGQYVSAGTQLMAVVPLHAVYVVANFKETQLTQVASGQPVAIEIDGFPGVALSGHVDSLAPASGLEFALLPPDNATGNFTKIVQRIPVRIALDDTELTGRLRAGMSVVPTVDTRATAATRTAAN